MAISFQSPWMLTLLLPLAWLLWDGWRREERFGPVKKRWIFALRGGLFLLLVLALAGVAWLFPVQHQAVVFVVDRSYSVAEPEQAVQYITEALKKKKPDDQAAIISVGAQAMVEHALSDEISSPSLDAVINRQATDLASGLRIAGGLIPQEVPGRVVVLTDGLETKGKAAQEANMLRDKGVRVDVVPLAARSGPEVLVDRVDVPQRLYRQEQASLTVKVKANVDTAATLTVYEGERRLAERKVQVKPGENAVTVPVQVNDDGFVRYRVTLSSPQDTMSQNNTVTAFSQVAGKPRVLLVEEASEEGNNLRQALQATGMVVERTHPAGIPRTLDQFKRYSSVILAHVRASSLSPQQMEGLRLAVKELGIGLMMTGGTEGFALGGWYQTPVEEALPVHMDIKDKKRLPPLGLMLVIDKSGSMGGEKIEVAKEAALRATELLTVQDRLGVLAFDDGFEWILSPQAVRDKKAIMGRIGGIPADGGTNIYPALAEAHQRLKQQKVKRKHIILLTDGQSNQGDYEGLTKQMKADGITLSTVAVGTDADVGLLETLARQAGGRHYLAETPAAIPTIFTKETTMAMREYIMDQPFTPKWTGGSDWSVMGKGVPPLRAYVATTPKRTAEVVLSSPYPDPVLARWQYGLGRTVAWTSDVNGKWSSAWVEWPAFASMMSEVVSWTFPQQATEGLYMEAEQEESGWVIRAASVGPDLSKQEEISLELLDGQGKKLTIPARAVAPGQFVGKWAEAEPGTYLVKASAGNTPLGSYGINVPYSAEFGLNEGKADFLPSLAQAGGGQLLANPGHAFADNLESRFGKQALSRWLLLMATCLWPLEIFLRKVAFSGEDWQRLRQRLAGLRSTGANASYVGTLKRLATKKSERLQQRIDEVPMFPPLEMKTKSTALTKEKQAAQRPSPQPASPPPQEPASEETHTSRLLKAKRRREQNR
ncbi:VWA domain-containing protein [Laceyella putida]|uniref:VWA domain-containing protein n=1 Tax=Laceyella putida TaxID=110101 RepID=A0ABW2RQL0_9BACL